MTQVEELDPDELDRLRNPFKPATPPPPRKGWVRGKVADIVREAEITPYGAGLIWRFNVVPTDGAPPVRVEMRGLDAVGLLNEGHIVDVFCGSRPKDPVVADYLWVPYYGSAIEVFYPGRPRLPQAESGFQIWPRSRVAAAGVLAVAALALAAAFVLGL